MKALIFLISIGMAFHVTSCVRPVLPTEDKTEFIYTVATIRPNYEKGLCRYDFVSPQTYVSFLNEFSVVDSIGKFNIGDCIRLRTEKVCCKN